MGSHHAIPGGREKEEKLSLTSIWQVGRKGGETVRELRGTSLIFNPSVRAHRTDHDRHFKRGHPILVQGDDGMKKGKKRSLLV